MSVTEECEQCPLHPGHPQPHPPCLRSFILPMIIRTTMIASIPPAITDGNIPEIQFMMFYAPFVNCSGLKLLTLLYVHSPIVIVRAFWLAIANRKVIANDNKKRAFRLFLLDTHYLQPPRHEELLDCVQIFYNFFIIVIMYDRFKTCCQIC